MLTLVAGAIGKQTASSSSSVTCCSTSNPMTEREGPRPCRIGGPFPEEILEKIIDLLDIGDRVRGMRVNRAWNRIARSSLAKQSSLAVVSERPHVCRYFSCCFGCHRVFISHLNILTARTVTKMQRFGVRIADYCPNVTVLKIEDMCIGSGTAVLDYYAHQVKSLSIPGIRVAGRSFPRLEHVETILHDYSDPVMQSTSSMRQALPMLQCISLSHMKFFLYEALLPEGVKHLSLLGANSLSQISESPASQTLTRLDYEEGFLMANQTDVSFRFPKLEAFFYEDIMNVTKFEALVQHLVQCEQLHTMRFYMAIAPLPPAPPAGPPVLHNNLTPASVWKRLFRGTPNLGEFHLHSLAYHTESLEFNDSVVMCMANCCPTLHTLIVFDKDNSLSDASLDHLSRLTNLQVLDIESKDSLFSHAGIVRFLTTCASRSKLRHLRIRGGKRRSKIYTEHSLVRTFLGGNEWRVFRRSDMPNNHSSDDPDIVSAVIWGQNSNGPEPNDPLQEQLDLLSRESCLKYHSVSGIID